MLRKNKHKNLADNIHLEKAELYVLLHAMRIIDNNGYGLSTKQFNIVKHLSFEFGSLLDSLPIEQ